MKHYTLARFNRNDCFIALPEYFPIHLQPLTANRKMVLSANLPEPIQLLTRRVFLPGNSTIPSEITIFPRFPEIAAGMVQNLIESQRRYGEIDLRPGLNDQRSKIPAPPILASCCYEIYQFTQNRHFLAEVYPALSAHIHRWIDSNHDLDQDRMPEWQSAEQTGWPENPLFDPWTEGAKGYIANRLNLQN